MPKYKYILIDADGTLFDYHRAERESLGKTFDSYGIEDSDSFFSELYNKINKDCWDKFEKGLLNLTELRLKRFSDLITEGKLGNIDPAEMGQKYLAYLAVSAHMLDGAAELLEALSETHSLVMITNGIKEIQYSRIKESGIGRYFDDVIISDEIGFQKPAGEYFDITMERIGNPDKSEILVIGDSLTSDIAGGNRYGLDTCWINFSSSNPVCPHNGRIRKDSEKLTGEYKPDYEVDSLIKIIDIVK